MGAWAAGWLGGWVRAQHGVDSSSLEHERGCALTLGSYLPSSLQGRPHRYVYGYASQFEDPSIGIAKVRLSAAFLFRRLEQC